MGYNGTVSEVPVSAAQRRRVNDTVAQLRALLPRDWSVDTVRQLGAVTVLRIADEQGTQLAVSMLAGERLEPREIRGMWRPEGPLLVSAGWLSERSRELLRDSGVSFLDRTGNAEIRLTKPGVFIRTDGASRDPAPKTPIAPSLRGPRAWSLLRTLAEVRPPYTAGNLAAVLQVDDGYVSRVLQVLAAEQIIDRDPRGPVKSVEWEPLLRRVTSTYSLLDANTTSSWIAVAGASQLLRDLTRLRVGRWAVTGSFVTSAVAPVAAPEIAVIYTDDPERLAKAARLLPSTTGTNVILAEPYDPIVFQRGKEVNQVPAVSIAQAAIDSLTGPGRMPAEGEAILTWMRKNEARWRKRGLAA